MPFIEPYSPIFVLVVEDEGLMRLHAMQLVEEAGYEPVEARNADEAIAILEARKDIRIVFTDIDMPGSMDGLKLARAIRDRWPPIELILTSGHFDVPEGDFLARGLFFSTPYHDNEIVSALRRFASEHRQLSFSNFNKGHRFRSAAYRRATNPAKPPGSG